MNLTSSIESKFFSYKKFIMIIDKIKNISIICVKIIDKTNKLNSDPNTDCLKNFYIQNNHQVILNY